MKNEEILTALRRLKVETGSLVCMGCGREHDCGIHGCRSRAGGRGADREADIPLRALCRGNRGAAGAGEWNDGEKDLIYCLGWVNPMTDCPLPECLACPDFVDKAQDDLETFYGRADNG